MNLPASRVLAFPSRFLADPPSNLPWLRERAGTSVKSVAIIQFSTTSFDPSEGLMDMPPRVTTSRWFTMDRPKVILARLAVKNEKSAWGHSRA
jgi:hypothetical protein